MVNSIGAIQACSKLQVLKYISTKTVKVQEIYKKWQMWNLPDLQKL
jgi:hypothetical protein